MPPKKKSKATGGAAAAAAAASVADESTTAAAAAAASASPSVSASPLHLTAGGVESLRLLARYRPHRVGMAGIGMAAATGAAMPPPPPPAPVTLQIVDIRRYFVDHRFWALVGVPLPTLPVAPSSLPMGAPQPSAAAADGNGNGMEELMGARMGAGAATAASAAAGAAPSSFDEQSDLHVAYDVLLSDGRQQVKVLLSPTLAIHAEKGGLLPTGVIRVREAALRFDETVVADPGFIVLRQIDIVADRTDQIVIAEEVGALSYPAWVDAAAQASKPLIGGPRSYYLSLFNDDTVHFDPSNYPEQSEAERVAMDQAALRAPVVPLDGEEESKEEFASANAGARASSGRAGSGPGSALAGRSRAAPRSLPLSMQDSVLLDAEVLYPGDTISIRRLIREGPGFQPGDLHIVGRIFAKSRIFNFGRKSVSRSDLLRSPFNFELLLGDSSGEQIKVVLWNTLVGAYFHRLHVGQVVAVRGFRLKQARADQQFELALNPYNPIGSVRVFSDADSAAGLAPSIWELVPPIVMTVSTVAQVATMPDESVFDLAGVVTYAGPMRREFAPSKKQFFQYRWLLVVDPSCTDAVPVKLFTNSHQEDVESIFVSDVLYLSNLTCRSSVSVGANDLLQVASLPSQQAGRSIVATSTHYTQMLGPEAMERSGHPYLLQLIQWGHQADHGLLRSHPSLWRWSLDFPLYRSMYSGAVTPLRDCQDVLRGLRFQQMRGVLVQAFVAEVVVHPAGMRAVQDGRMDQVQYDAALRHLALIAPEGEGDEGHDAAAAAAAAGAEKPAAAAAPRGKKGRARFAPSAEGEASAAEVSASQSSTVSSRLRRSARSQTVGDTRATETAAASSRAASETRSGRSRTRGAAQGEAPEGEEEAGRHRASSADIGTPVKRRGKLVKIVQRRLKRKERPEGEEETAAAAAAAASVAAPSPAVAVAAVSSPSFFSGSGSINGSSPSSPSTLCTLLLRDLNGEFDLCVQLQDPVLGHVSFDRAVGSIHAAGYETPPAAPRIFDGLSRVLPASAFTREEWRTLIEQASGVEIEEEVAAPAAAAAAAGPSRGRGKKAAAAAAPPAARPRDEFSIRRAAIVQLHQALLAALSPLRLLASAMLVRESYTHTHANLTAVFSAL